MKSSELMSKDKKSLVDMLVEKRAALQAFRFGSAGSKTRDVKEGRNTKKDIARILTSLNRKDR